MKKDKQPYVEIGEKDITNALKFYYRTVVKNIRIENVDSNSFDTTIELPLEAHRLEFKSIEVPVGGVKFAFLRWIYEDLDLFYVKRLLSLLTKGQKLYLRE